MSASEVTIPSLQEMFDRAWKGLSGQQWRKSFSGGACVYYDPTTGRRCAWGHVDLSLDQHLTGGVTTLHRDGVGIAANLDSLTMPFAKELQMAHDKSMGPSEMEWAMRRIAAKHNLTIPEGI